MIGKLSEDEIEFILKIIDEIVSEMTPEQKEYYDSLLNQGRYVDAVDYLETLEEWRITSDGNRRVE